MKISKFIHSCILLKEGNEQLLIDPGSYTFLEGAVKPEDFEGVQTVLITHEHTDHYDLGALKMISARNSGLEIYANTEMVKVLAQAGLEAKILENGSVSCGNFKIEAFETPHEQVLSPAPANTAFIINGKFMHIGDSLSSKIFEREAQVIALPVAAPWMTDVKALDFSKHIKPERFIPVHDGYLKDFFNARKYGIWEKVFGEQGIKFDPLSKPGDSIEI